ncbi:T9SS type B sorting domain-containing protein [Pedobacter nanyangensis]|uniref:T9SS type B sorting domain-containing protein n=1 Tax=Pedobacter nanyangensis TaxID=1562389 RepID=UPI000DE297AA|nr:gliding motility-associated C-terminal domain-containing protein [Pedobacter nanyangensis]
MVALLLQVVVVKAQTAKEVRIRQGGTVHLRVDNPNGTYSYQWYRYGKPISGANTFMYTAGIEGDYQVRAINQGDCQSDLSDIFRVIVEFSNLEVKKKSEDRFVGPNEPFTYTITVRNIENTDNPNVQLTDIFPPNLKFISMEPPRLGTAQYANGQITWTIPLLVAGAPPETLVVKAQGIIAGTIVNTASVESGDPTLTDPDPDNNKSTDVKKIIGNIKVPNVITPNGDGKNDVLKIDGIELYKENSLAIFNRWGNEVYRSPGNYINNWSGEGLSEGTYYYVLKLVSKEGAQSAVTGYITLLRDK